MTHGANESVGRGKTLAIVLCAGQGARMGAAQNKIFLPLAGMPVGAHAIKATLGFLPASRRRLYATRICALQRTAVTVAM